MYYQPGQPAEAVLQTGLDGSELFLLMMLVPFNLVMLWLFAWVGRTWKAEPPLLSTFFREDGSECVTLEGTGTVTWVFLAIGVSALGSVVLTGAMVGLNTPLPVGEPDALSRTGRLGAPPHDGRVKGVYLCSPAVREPRLRSLS